MAQRRKRFRPAVKVRRSEDVYAAFIAAVLSGDIQAIKLIVAGGTPRRPEFTYDDPNG